MNALPKLDILDLETTLTHYDIGELTRYWPTSRGTENTNYFVRTLRPENQGEAEYVLTILEQPSNAGVSYVPLLDTCIAAGLPVPDVVRNRNGHAYEELHGKPVLLSRRLPGKHVHNPTQKQLAGLGRFIARLHLATAGVPFPVPEYPRDGAWLAGTANRLNGYLPFGTASLIRDSIDKIRSLLDRQDVAALPQGVIHGDLFRDNVLYNDLGLCGALDFHHASRGFLLYDLAVAANDWCTDGAGVMGGDRVMALLSAYHSLRPLTPQELWFFSTFALYAALAFWLSRLRVAGIDARKEDRADKAGCNNPLEFERIVRQLSAHAFFPDPRHL